MDKRKECLEKIRQTYSTLVEFRGNKSEVKKMLNYDIVLQVLEEFAEALTFLLKEEGTVLEGEEDEKES